MSMQPPKFPRWAIALMALFLSGVALTSFVLWAGAPPEEFVMGLVIGILGICFVFISAEHSYEKDMYAFKQEFERYYGFSYSDYLQMKMRDKSQANETQAVNTPRVVMYREGPLSFDDIVARGEAGIKVYVPAFQQWCEVDPDSDSVYGNECYCDIAHAVLIGTYDHE